MTSPRSTAATWNSRAEPAAEHRGHLGLRHALARHPNLGHGGSPVRGAAPGARRRYGGCSYGSAAALVRRPARPPCPAAATRRDVPSRRGSAGRWPAGPQRNSGSRSGTGPRLARNRKPGSRAKNSASSGACQPAHRVAARPGPVPRAGCQPAGSAAPPVQRQEGVRVTVLRGDAVLTPSRGLRAATGRRGGEASSVRENPKEGPPRSHGSGTRQPSRPATSPPVRKKVGSCRAASGMSVTSGSPSSSPW